MCYNCGYNPTFSNIIMGGRIATSALDAVSSGLRASNSGATPIQAAFFGVGQGLTGIGNALIGCDMDRYTHSYWGSMMSSGGFNFMSPYCCMPMNMYNYNSYCMPQYRGTISNMMGQSWYC